MGAKVIAISGPDGYVYIKDGMTPEGVDYMLDLRASNKNIVAPFARQIPGVTFIPGKKLGMLNVILLSRALSRMSSTLMMLKAS